MHVSRCAGGWRGREMRRCGSAGLWPTSVRSNTGTRARGAATGGRRNYRINKRVTNCNYSKQSRRCSLYRRPPQPEPNHTLVLYSYMSMSMYHVHIRGVDFPSSTILTRGGSGRLHYPQPRASLTPLDDVVLSKQPERAKPFPTADSCVQYGTWLMPRDSCLTSPLV